MIDFKEWWNKQEIFCGEGGMEAAEEAFDYLSEKVDMLHNEAKRSKRLVEVLKTVCDSEGYYGLSENCSELIDTLKNAIDDIDNM